MTPEQAERVANEIVAIALNTAKCEAFAAEANRVRLISALTTPDAPPAPDSEAVRLLREFSHAYNDDDLNGMAAIDTEVDAFLSTLDQQKGGSK